MIRINAIADPEKKHSAACLTFSPDGKLLAVAGRGLQTSVYDVTTQTLIWQSNKYSADHRLGLPYFSPDGKYLTRHWETKTIFNAQTGEIIKLSEEEQGWLPPQLIPGTWLRLLSNEKNWFVEYEYNPIRDGACRLFDIRECDKTNLFAKPLPTSREVKEDDPSVNEPVIAEYTLRQGEDLPLKPYQEGLERELTTRSVPLTFHPFESWILFAADNRGYLVELPTLKIVHTFDFVLPVGQVTAETHVAHFSPDGKRLYVLDNGIVRTWSVPSFAERDSYNWQLPLVMCLTVSPDGLQAAIGSDNGSIHIWDLD